MKKKARKRPSTGRGDALLALADVSYLRSEFHDTQTRAKEALAIYESFADPAGAIETRLEIAYALMDQGNDAEAEPHLTKALDEARAIGNKRQAALAHRVLGLAHSKLSENAEAIRQFELSQELFEAADDAASVVALYDILGELHQRTNDLSAALDYYRKARSLGGATHFVLGEVVASLNIGRCLRLRGDPDEAVEAYENARQLSLEIGHKAMEGAALAGLGNLLADRKDFGPAIEHLTKAASLNVEAGNGRRAADILNDLGEAYAAMDRLVDATDAAERALGYAREASEPSQQARALALEADLLRRRGLLDEARRSLELALDVDEAMRLRVPGGELRALAFQGAQERYESYVSLLMQISRESDAPDALRLALEAVERSRSRSLLDGVRGTFDPALTGATDSIAEREKRILEEVRELALREDLGSELADSRSLSERLAELRRLRGLATRGSAELEDANGAALAADEIEAYFAGKDSLLLEYFLGSERSYLWAVGGGRFEVFELPPGPALEEQIREALALLTSRQAPSEAPLRERAAQSEQSDSRFLRLGISLSRELLGSLTDLDAFSRLVIVSNGALNTLPTGVLPHPRRSGEDTESYLPLIATHEIVRAPSGTTMLAIASRSREHASDSSIAIVADPVFTPDDPRLHANRSATDRLGAEASSTLAADLRGSGRNLASLGRLLASREEVLAISEIAPRAATVAMDFEANRPTAEELLAEPFRVVPFPRWRGGDGPGLGASSGPDFSLEAATYPGPVLLGCFRAFRNIMMRTQGPLALRWPKRRPPNHPTTTRFSSGSLRTGPRRR